MKLVFEKVMPPKTGLAAIVKSGQHVRLVDLEGQQVIDMAVFNHQNTREKLSKSYSRTRTYPLPKEPAYVIRDKLVPGDTLFSTICRPMMVIVEETAIPKGVHDVHLRCCNRYYYESIGVGERDGCLEIISDAVAEYGILPEDVPDPFGVFMNVQYDSERGQWVIKEPITRPGDHIEFRALMDCVIGLSNCPEDLTSVNAGKCTPVKLEIYA